MKKLTHEEFVAKIAKANPNIKITGTYINRTTRISISCRKCGKVIEVFPQNLFAHSGLCRECSIAETKTKATKTHEEFESELLKNNPNIILTGRYVNSVTPIEWKCRMCGKPQYSRPSTLKNATGYCNSCSSRITHDEYIKRVKKKNPNIQIVGQFIDSNTPIEWKCNRCGRISLANPKEVSHLSGICKQCQFEEKRDEFYRQYNTLKTPPILLSAFEGVTKKIKCKCRVCGYEWSSLPSVIITYKTPCPKCSDKANRIKPEAFVAEMKELNPNIEILGVYNLSNEPVLCRCRLCNNEWTARPGDLKRGKGCPECNHTSTSFVEQLFLLSLIDKFGNDAVLSRDKKAINKELDIFLPSKKLAIEYGAWYWHKNRITNDQEKVAICESKGIHLFCVYDSCKELNEIDTAQFKNSIFYIESLSENDELFQKLLSQILSFIGEDYSISNEAWKRIKHQAYIRSRKKTTKEFVDELSNINDSILVLGEYKGSAIPVQVKCLQCGRVWEALPKELLKGAGCSFCYHQKQKDSQDEFIDKLNEINENIVVLGNYEGRKNRVLVKCKICGNEWEPFANSLLMGKGCPKCNGFHPQRSREDVLSEIKNKNPNIEIIGEYKNTSSPILVKCKKCGREWNTTPSQLIKGSSCLICFQKSKKKTHEQFVEEMAILHPNIEVVGKYQKALEPVLLHCKICGYNWKAKPNVSLSGRGCPCCAGKKVLRGYNDLQTVNPALAKEWNFEKNDELTPMDVMPNSDRKVWWRCSNGHEWQAAISSRNHGRGCPYCVGQKVLRGYNDLQTVNPALAKEWNFEKNKNLKPEDCTASSGKKVWWICNNGHEWQAKINNRNHGCGCPYCAGRKK